MTVDCKKTVLIADDDPVMLKLLQFNLSKAGFHVVSCNEGSSVLEVALAERPSIALLDYLLPGRTGLELIGDFKKNAALASVPIVVVTGQGKGSTRQELLDAGALEVFTKPFSPSLLIDTIEKQLGLKKREVKAPLLNN